MVEAVEKDKQKILHYLRGNLADCLYLYIDIMNYGIGTENMKVWIEEESGSLSLVVMKYYDSFQIYSHPSLCDITPVVELLKQFPVAMISGKKDMIQLLENECKEYKAAYGMVFVMDRYRNIQTDVDVQPATEEDALEIAELICSDVELGGHYTVSNLAEQLAERIRTKTGRSYIIREKGVIVAHSATYAEAEGIAVVSGTIIKPEYRTGNYYMALSNHMLQQLEKESKVAYTFSITNKMIRYHSMLHTRCGEYGKLVKIQMHE